MNLNELGWTVSDQSEFDSIDDSTLTPCRVSEEHKRSYRLLTGNGEVTARTSGRLRHRAADANELPAVGDWVAVRLRPDEDTGTIVVVLPRRSALIRAHPDRPMSPQVIASNLDTVFVMVSLNQDFNLKRLERYLTLVWESGARPVLLLTKLDLCRDATGYRDRAAAVAPEVNVHMVSALTGEGIEALSPYLQPGQTIALIGSSGVGKSTLLNRLMGRVVMATAEIRQDDDMGRHTTSHRSLKVLPGGAMLIDTPGMRELALWDSSGALGTTFEDVEVHMLDCRFSDCRHDGEPDCGVMLAIEDGRLEAGRYASYVKLQHELAQQARRMDERAQLQHDQQMKRIYKAREKSLRSHDKNR